LFGEPLGKNRELSGVIGESGKIGKNWELSGFRFLIPDNSRLGNYREWVLAICFGDNQPRVCAPAKHCCSVMPPPPIAVVSNRRLIIRITSLLDSGDHKVCQLSTLCPCITTCMVAVAGRCMIVQ
jgi:hypothetical protein